MTDEEIIALLGDAKGRIERPTFSEREERDARYLLAAIKDGQAGQIMDMVREMDFVVHELGIADSFKRPSEEIRQINTKLEEGLAKIDLSAPARTD